VKGPQQSLLDAVLQVASDPARRIYAVMDGAQFDNLPAELASFDLAHRSLYRNVQDIELVKAGPWLIDPYHQPDPMANVWGGLPFAGDITPAVAVDAEDALSERDMASLDESAFHGMSSTTDPAVQLEKVIQLTGHLPAAVFWAGDNSLSEPVLWRHLRTINMVLLPQEQPIGKAAQRGMDAYDAFLFRHADGNVLAEVLPFLDASQFSRVFGPAREIVFLAPEHPSVSSGSPLRRAIFPLEAPLAPAGLLKLSQPQIDGIEDIRNEASRRDTVAYLREYAPDDTSGMSDAALNTKVAGIEQRGFDLGFVSMTTHLLFVFMCVTGAWEESDDAELRQAIKEGEMEPDNALDEVYASMIEAGEEDTAGLE
jgi:Domain of unknown function (DUF4123)